MALKLITVNSLSNKKQNRTKRTLLKHLARMGGGVTMKCSGCFREIEEGEKAYATVTGSIEKNLLLNNALGFYMDLQPWHSVLCKDCGMAVHDFIDNQLQMRNLQESEKPVRKTK